ncbi:MAG: hypothetical protein WD042_13690 [Phycisphaeraceae bacterium]
MSITGHITTAEQVEQWIASGCRLVWVADPQTHSIMVHTPDRAARRLALNDLLTGGDVVPGFQVPVAQIFE